LSSFNTVFTYDIWQTYVKKDQPDHYYLSLGRVVTAAASILAIGTAFIASTYANLMDYLQTLFSFFNAPLFATFILGMFWKRMSPAAGFWGLLAGTAGAIAAYYLKKGGVVNLGSAQSSGFWGAAGAFGCDGGVSIAVRPFT